MQTLSIFAKVHSCVLHTKTIFDLLLHIDLLGATVYKHDLVFTERRECYFESDKGNSYNGYVNISETGKPCRIWTNVSSYYVNSNRWHGEFDENYCRGWGDYGRVEIKPACIVDKDGTEEKCNISLCGNQ